MAEAAPLPPTGAGSRPWSVTAIPFVLTVVACLVGGLLGQAIDLPPAEASPLDPAAGLALASVLVYGWAMLGAVALAAFAVQLVSSAATSIVHAPDVTLSLLLAVAATLQALLGAVLVRRFVSQPLTLTRPGDVVRFYACCALASVVAPLLGTSVLVAIGAVARHEAFYNAAAGWLGNVAGMLLAAPVALTLIGRPRSEWAPRRLPVGVSLTLVTALLALGLTQIGRWNEERLRKTFEHDASNAALVIADQLQEPLRALEALRAVATVARPISRQDVRIASEHWIEGSALRVMGWAERVRRDDVAAYEARVRSEGVSDFRIVDRRDAAARSALPGIEPSRKPGSTQGEVMAIRFVEPVRGNTSLIGLDALSFPAVEQAIAATAASGKPVATAAFDVARSGSDTPGSGVVVFRAVADGAEAATAEPREPLRGVVFVGLGVDRQLAAVAPRLPAYLKTCVVDLQPGQAARRLAGRVGCELASPGRLTHERALAFAGRDWRIRAVADPAEVPEAGDRREWPFAAAGLVSVAMLCASLLVTTGRTRRIESAVRERTTALRAEVADRQVAEAALRASEERFRNILDNVPIGVVYSDLQGRIIQANPRYCELTGHAEDELTAMAPAELTPPDDLQHDDALTALLVRGEIPMYRRNKSVLTRSGETLFVRATVTLLRDAHGEPWRIVAVVEDISEHLRLEEAERAREQAEASNRAKSDFLSRMSHELRTPLNAMLGFAQLLEIDTRNPLAPAQRPWVGQIQQAGWHLLEMINDVLDLSRIESGNLQLHTTTVDLPEAVTATIALVTADAAKRDIRISEDLASGAAGVLGDATRVKQILTNLLSNAVKYNVEGGRIHVASRLVDAETLEISVTDTGMGMTREQMDELFKPFNRLGRERSTLEGTGIGLVISQRLAELMRGSIGVKSIPGQGSAFTLRLPRAHDLQTVRDPLEDLDALPSDYHRRVVHYVEDNETNVEVMRGILAQRPQVQMVVSTSGLDGLAAVRAQRPHLLLLDMHLPDISGLELLRHLKADAGTATIPVLVVSADALEPQIDAAMASGAVAYLTKPVDVAELLRTIDEVLDRVDTAFS